MMLLKSFFSNASNILGFLIQAVQLLVLNIKHYFKFQRIFEIKILYVTQNLIKRHSGKEQNNKIRKKVLKH